MAFVIVLRNRRVEKLKRAIGVVDYNNVMYRKA